MYESTQTQPPYVQSIHRFSPLGNVHIPLYCVIAGFLSLTAWSV